MVNYNRGTVGNSEQYKLTINKDPNMTDTHVELLPDDNNEYWIPKGYKVKVSADCNEGYQQNGGSNVYTIDNTQTVSLDSTPAPPSEIEELKEEIASLQQHVSDLEKQSISDNNTTSYIDSPLGSISPYGGNTIPDGWMLCDGKELSRSEYADLFDVIGTSFGEGDGNTTFNIPDLRGEFLRGAGNNSHSNQGNGGSVGQHQDATKHVATGWGSDNGEELNGRGRPYIGANNYTEPIFTKNYDWNQTERHTVEVSGDVTYFADQDKNITQYYTSRPTNTSVNFIIKVNNISSSPTESTQMGHQYSTEEQWTGNYWVDGKKIYRQIIVDSRVPNSTFFNIPCDLQNIKNLTFWNANFESEQQGYNQFYLGKTSADLENELFLSYVNKQFLIVYCGRNINHKTIKSIITLEYTKTTD